MPANDVTIMANFTYIGESVRMGVGHNLAQKTLDSKAIIDKKIFVAKKGSNVSISIGGNLSLTLSKEEMKAISSGKLSLTISGRRASLTISTDSKVMSSSDETVFFIEKITTPKNITSHFSSIDGINSSLLSRTIYNVRVIRGG